MFDGFNEAALQALFDRQKRLRQQFGQAPPALVIIEDCFTSNIWDKSKIMRKLFVIGRHYGIWLFYIVNYLCDVPKRFRSQTDFFILTAERGVFPSFKVFNAIFMQMTTDKHVMIIDASADNSSMSVEGTVYRYKAEKDIPPYLLGSQNYWLAHYKALRKKNANPEVVARCKNVLSQFNEASFKVLPPKAIADQADDDPKTTADI